MAVASSERLGRKLATSLSKPTLKGWLLAGKLCSRAGGVVEYDFSDESAASSYDRPRCCWCCLLPVLVLGFDLETGSETDRLDASIRAYAALQSASAEKEV